MLSNRLCLGFYFLINTGNKLGAFPIRCHQNTLIVSKDPINHRVVFNTLQCIIWAVLCIYLTIWELAFGEINKLILKFLFTICAAILMTALSIPILHSSDVAKLINGIFDFLRLIGSKLKKQMFLINKTIVFINAFFNFRKICARISTKPSEVKLVY